MQLILCFVLQLGSAARLQGITPAAVVNLLGYVVHTGQRERIRHRNQPDQKEEKEEEHSARNASLPQ